MKRLLLLYFTLFCLTAGAQKVRLTQLNQNYTRVPNVQGFDYLHDELDRETFVWIADALVEFDTIFPTTIKDYYAKLIDKANKIGANAFRVNEAQLNLFGATKTISLSFYFLNYENKKENAELFQEKKIYLFGFLGYHQRVDGYEIKLNEQKLVLNELSYKEVVLSSDKQIHIQLSHGLKKNWVNVPIENNMTPRYYKFDYYEGVMNRGQISEYEWSFGEFLIRILQKEILTLNSY